MNFYILLQEFLGTFLLVLGLLCFNNPIFLGLLYTIILFLTQDTFCNPAFTFIRYLAKKINIYETIYIIIDQFFAGIVSYNLFRLLA